MKKVALVIGIILASIGIVLSSEMNGCGDFGALKGQSQGPRLESGSDSKTDPSHESDSDGKNQSENAIFQSQGKGDTHGKS